MTDLSFIIDESLELSGLVRDISNDTLFHSIIFECADPLLTEAAVQYLLLHIFCDKKSGCGKCAGCRGIINRTNVDVFIYRGKALTDTVEAIVSGLGVIPLSCKRVYVIQNAETLAPAAQSKLLKSLEEPPRDTHFILCVPVIDILIPTVRSRCRIVSLRPLSVEAVRRAMGRLYEGDPAVGLASELSGGSLAAAEVYITQTPVREIFELAMDIFANLTGSPYAIKYSSAVAELQSRFPLFLEYYAKIARDLLAVNSSGIPLLKSRESDILHISKQFSCAALIKIIESCATAALRYKFNGNAASVAEELLFTMLEVKALCR